MARPTNEQMVSITSYMAARALTRAADPETRKGLEAALKSWVLDADALTIRELAQGAAEDFRTMAAAILERRDRMEQRGVAAPWPPAQRDGA